MTTKIKIETNEKGEIQKLNLRPNVLGESEAFRHDLLEIENYLLKKSHQPLKDRLYSRAMFDFLAAEKEYLGEPVVSVGEVICYCTGLTRSHFVRLIQENPKKTIEDLRIETKATLMCRGCKKDFQQVFDNVLAENGATSKLAEKLTRKKIDEHSRRVTYKGQYPAYWIKVILDLQTSWQEREDFNESFQFEILDATVPFVDFLTVGEIDHHKAKIYFEHFHLYVEEATKAKWYFELKN